MAKPALSRAIKLYGTDVPDGKRRTLTAGPITAMLDNGALRYIRYRGTEVLRGISYLLRDKNWGTYGPAIEDLKVRQGKDGFSVSYTATAKDKPSSRIAGCKNRDGTCCDANTGSLWRSVQGDSGKNAPRPRTKNNAPVSFNGWPVLPRAKRSPSTSTVTPNHPM